jgi:hypothetical protein
VIASSATVMSNLAYLVGAVVVAVIGGLVVWLRHRQPKSVDATMESFRRGLDVIAPQTQNGRAGGRRNEYHPGIRPEPGGLAGPRADSAATVSALPGGFPPLPVDVAGHAGLAPGDRQAGDQPG